MADNRRTSHRYGVGGKVKIFGQGLSPTLTGSILDLSLGGCLLQVDAEFYLAQDSEVELTIQSKGTSFRVKGEVKLRGRSTNPVGIAFATMTERVREDIAYLIGELAEADLRSQQEDAAQRKPADQQTAG